MGCLFKQRRIDGEERREREAWHVGDGTKGTRSRAQGRLTTKDFGCHVLRRPNHPLAKQIPPLIIPLSRNYSRPTCIAQHGFRVTTAGTGGGTEVDELELSVGEDKVVRFDVAVSEALFVLRGSEPREE